MITDKQLNVSEMEPTWRHHVGVSLAPVLGVSSVATDAVIPASQTMRLNEVWVHNDLTAA